MDHFWFISEGRDRWEHEECVFQWIGWLCTAKLSVGRRDCSMDMFGEAFQAKPSDHLQGALRFQVF